MIKVPVYNNQGTKEKEMELNPAIFGVEPKQSVVHQVYVAQMANQRGNYAHTKGRGEVAGGGKKPWRQKGTGRARHGSTRSPIWRGGGITFGPRNDRNFKQKINKKMRQLAVRMCLSDKAATKRLIVVDGLASLEQKTKHFDQLLKTLEVRGKTTLVLTMPQQQAVSRCMRNIPRVDIHKAAQVNVIDLLHHQYVVTTPEAVEAINGMFKSATARAKGATA